MLLQHTERPRHNWDGYPGDETIKPALRYHLNGNGVYDINHPLLQLALQRFVADEEWADSFHSSFDVAIAEVLMEEQGVSVEQLDASPHGYVAVAFSVEAILGSRYDGGERVLLRLQYTALLHSRQARRAKQMLTAIHLLFTDGVTRYKASSILTNFATTLTLPQDIAPEVKVVHGAVYVHNWPTPSCTRHIGLPDWYPYSARFSTESCARRCHRIARLLKHEIQHHGRVHG
jgi:hypothetical protein